MSKVRQILNHVDVETAIRRRTCHHNRQKHSVPKDTRCLTIKDQASGGSKNYCPTCASEILDQAERDLKSLRRRLLT